MLSPYNLVGPTTRLRLEIRLHVALTIAAKGPTPHEVLLGQDVLNLLLCGGSFPVQAWEVQLGLYHDLHLTLVILFKFLYIVALKITRVILLGPLLSEFFHQILRLLVNEHLGVVILHALFISKVQVVRSLRRLFIHLLVEVSTFLVLMSGPL